MSQGLGMSLDDYIKASKPARSSPNFNNNSRRFRPNFQKSSGSRFRSSGNYQQRFKQNDHNDDFESNGGFNKKRHWEHDRFEEEDKDFQVEKGPKRYSQAGGQETQAFNSRNSIRISNLHYAIINKDLHDLFDQFGEITRCEIDWDEIGRSKGTAIIQFAEEEAAKKAIDEYNGAELDGQKLVIEYYKKESVPMLRRGGIQKDRFRPRGGFTARRSLCKGVPQQQEV